METTKHAGGRKILRLFKKLNKELSKSLPTTDVCEWHLEMSFTNDGTPYMMRVCFDYDHKIITYQEGDNRIFFMAKVKEAIDFYKNYDKP